MMNEFLHRYERGRPGGLRPDPDPAWALLSQNLTGYDWHGGYYAAPAPYRGGHGIGFTEWRRRRSAAREVERLSARERRDARLPEPARRPVSRDALWQRVASWAMARVPGDPCREGGC